MFDVARYSGNNDGGHKTVVSFLPIGDLDVSSWPGLIASPTSNADYVTLDTGDIVAVSTKKWLKIETEIEMIGSGLGSEGSAGSISMVGNPKIRFNNITADLLGFIDQVRNAEGLWVLKDLADVQWIYGSPELPAKLQEATGDFSMTVDGDKFLEFTLRAIELPKVYPGTISYAAVV